MCHPPILGIHFGYDSILTTQYLGNPPSKLQHVLYSIQNRILRDLERVLILDVFNLNPIRVYIVPQYHYLPSYSRDRIPIHYIGRPDLYLLL